MVIENAKLKELVAKGPKYQEPNKINWKSTKTMILAFIDLMRTMVQTRTGRSQIPIWMERQNQRISSGTYPKFEREDSITKTENY